MASKPGGPCWQGRRRRCHFILYITAVIVVIIGGRGNTHVAAQPALHLCIRGRLGCCQLALMCLPE